MAFDPYIAERIERILGDKKVSYYPKYMMGGVAFMVDDKMCIGILSSKPEKPSQIMARVGPDIYDEAASREGCHKSPTSGRTMKGYIFIDQDALDTDQELEYWVQLCLDFNPIAKVSKKRKKA